MTDIYAHEKKKEEQTLIQTDTGKRKKEQYIENLKEGDVVNDLFAVKIKNPPRTYKKGTWFGFIANDKTGEIGVKFWGGDNKDRVKRLFESFSAGDVIQLRTGYVEVYEDKPQISINENTGGIRRCNQNEYDVSDFLPSLEESQIKELYDYLRHEMKTITNEHLKELLAAFFDDKQFITDFTHSPSAMSHHHNYVGGNLQHTVGVIRLCLNICEMYPGINKDLVVTGAILHDVGKLKEYIYGASIDKSEEGNFIGHIVIGDRMIREKIEELKTKGKLFPKELENQLIHLILSHHGKYEWGSPKMPKTIEACVLHQADLMDSQVKNYMQHVEEGRKTTDEDWMFIYDSDVGKKRLMYLGDQ
ncbi:MAG: HD domain-containing protein [Euryarchaeota archaeon]|nr:HD domain-containing protein [Euryarchaeota archaeon]